MLAVVLPLVFPDGAPERGAGRWWLRLAGLDLALFAAMMIAQPTLVDDRVAGVDNPLGLPAALRPVAETAALVVFGLGVACLVAGLVSVAGRWRHGTPLVRQQVGWFALGLLVALTGAVAPRPPACSPRRSSPSPWPPSRSRSASPSCSTGCTRSTSWSTATLLYALLTVRGGRASTCWWSPARARC